ncbi:uncharacterized protein LOC101845281 [Aplysia californica]|uniref:Uncharacterized protein LOC101845281 n=1 Tax=Aplysia californica TaxID=6500 RepID=A0ABM0JA69_APLCA|nr:uncharacterized protein LOC101845281 [Aplysia californica]
MASVEDLVGLYMGFLVALPVALLGVAANLINAAVFLHQGVKDCVSVCLLALTISDLCSVLSGGIIYTYNLLIHFNVYSVIHSYSFAYVVSYICSMFYDISQAVMAFVTLERCLCVAMPLKFKEIFTLRRAVVIVSALYIFTVAAYVPHYVSTGLISRWDPTTNTTRLFLWVADYRPDVQLYLRFFLQTVMAALCQAVVLVSTYVMVRGLKESTKFRQRREVATPPNVNGETKEDPSRTKKEVQAAKSDSGKEAIGKQGQGQLLSEKNLRVVKTVTALAILSLVCNSVRLVVVLINRVVSGLALGGRFHNVIILMSVGTFVFQTINASANILVYYNMNASFRNTLKTLIICKIRSLS